MKRGHDALCARDDTRAAAARAAPLELARGRPMSRGRRRWRRSARGRRRAAAVR